jgi:glycosidase
MAKTLAVFSFTWNGIPLIYSGQELPNMKRLKFFEKDPIEWNGKYELADFYKTLTTLKTNNPALRTGDTAVTTYMITTTQPEKVLAYLRKNGKKEVLVFINFSSKATFFNVHQTKDISINGHYKDVFYKKDVDLSVLSSQSQLELEPWSCMVFEK